MKLPFNNTLPADKNWFFRTGKPTIKNAESKVDRHCIGRHNHWL